MRKQTIHLVNGYEGDSWCGLGAASKPYPDTDDIDDATCGPCLKAAAAYGRAALARAVVLGICPVAVELP